MTAGADPRGSVWRRWDPHIHAPGTVLNDQYTELDAWEQYLHRIEVSDPIIEALGITDYASVDLYERVVAARSAGRLPQVGLIFPNVELRFGIGTAKGAAVNVHLLVSPEDPEHVALLRRFLATLTFEVAGETFHCTPEDLIRLGRVHDPSRTDATSALKAGTNQFKVSVDGLRDALRRSTWARDNIIIGVAGASGDGTSGLQSDSSLTEVRREVERMSRVVFSGQPAQRAFWLGELAESVERLEAVWGGRKVCLHGSDAHALAQVGAPELDRYTWVKGDASFESLRQACIDPETRALVASKPPSGPLAFRTIASVEIENAAWCVPSHISLNPGLVAIIGARGSGKTALADLIAAGGFADNEENERSFLRRAGDHLGGTRVRLHWGHGEATLRELGERETVITEAPRVQYLSQQFVEQLCSSEGGVTDELLGEIERVIYDAHPLEGRAGTTNFQELLAASASRGRTARARHEEALDAAGLRVIEERRKLSLLDDLKRQHRSAVQAIAEDKVAREALIVQGGEARAGRLREVVAALDDRQQSLDSLERQRQALLGLGDAVQHIRETWASAIVAQLVRDHGGARLTDEEWELFRMRFSGDVDAVIAAKMASVEAGITSLTGAQVSPQSGPAADATPYVSDQADLSTVPVAALRLEGERLRALIGLDEFKSRQLQALNTKISREEIALNKLVEAIDDAEGAPARIKSLSEQRAATYAAVFDALLDEEQQLNALYAPLKALLSAQPGVLGRLAFSVRRVVDLDVWAHRGESLLDLRTTGPFRGHGALREAASERLLPAWQNGSSVEVAAAMAEFRREHDADLLDHSPVPRRDRTRFWAWGAEVSAWLTSTDHIDIRYSIEYDGVDVAQLSPGTRGIVLLLLYLSVDQTDDRPLVIDQPEENLDPKSIFDELVQRFRSSRVRRQVVIVTHNANLVVNTDAEQVIVASAGPHRAGQLPQMSYLSGGLENLRIRHEASEILEGGEQAFKERARRLRVKLDR